MKMGLHPLKMRLHSMKMRLRIVMPVFNEAGHAAGGSDRLRGTLKALQPLRQQGAELIVVDGGSVDNTWALARTLADQVLLAPQGRAVQMNTGARYQRSPHAATDDQSNGEADVLLFLHSDSRLPANADQLIDAALRGGAVWGRFDVQFDSTHPVLRMVALMMNLRSRLYGIATGDQALFVTRQVFEQVGGFAKLPLMEDIELCSRLKQVAAPACLSQRVTTSARRWQRHGIWRTVFLMWRLRLAYFWGADPHALALRYGYPQPPAQAAAAVAIMAKAPVPGLSKTRLVPALGARGAARVQRKFTLNTLHMARQTALGNVTLHCAPDVQHRFFRALQRECSTTCEAQPQGDLGYRMQCAFAQHFARQPGQSLILIGTDCPVLSPGHVQQVARALLQNDVVLIPAEDGGYVLIGMRCLVAQVFQDIAWSTPQVMSQTRTQLRRAAVTWRELPTLWDVDEPADWHRLQELEQLETGP